MFVRNNLQSLSISLNISLLTVRIFKEVTKLVLRDILKVHA